MSAVLVDVITLIGDFVILAVGASVITAAWLFLRACRGD